MPLELVQTLNTLGTRSQKWREAKRMDRKADVASYLLGCVEKIDPEIAF